jgi:hypothetical protein
VETIETVPTSHRLDLLLDEMRRSAQLLLPVIALIAYVSAQTTLKPQLHGAGEASHSQFGILKLNVTRKSVVPDDCSDFTDVCTLETSHQVEAAIAAYEDRLQRCGLVGWKKLGHLGAGHAATVALRTTPCGLHVAMKGTHQERLLGHIQFDCTIMRELVDVLDHANCRGCFPRYYYSSNLTGYCYYEYIPSVPIPEFFDHVNVSTANGFRALRVAFLEGLDALAILQDKGIKHQDLTFRNILVRVPTIADPQRRFQLVILDFGGSESVKSGHTPGLNRDILGNRGHSDIYSYICSFLTYLYPDVSSYCMEPSRVVGDGVGTSLRTYLARVLQEHYDYNKQADYASLRERFSSVDRL